jgi:hypothetical protein
MRASVISAAIMLIGITSEVSMAENVTPVAVPVAGAPQLQKPPQQHSTYVTLPPGLLPPVGIVTNALVPWYNEKTGQRYTAPTGGYQAEPGSGWRMVKSTNYGPDGRVLSFDPINAPPTGMRDNGKEVGVGHPGFQFPDRWYNDKTKHVWDALHQGFEAIPGSGWSKIIRTKYRPDGTVETFDPRFPPPGNLTPIGR